jgi:hypothetical protein
VAWKAIIDARLHVGEKEAPDTFVLRSRYLERVCTTWGYIRLQHMTFQVFRALSSYSRSTGRLSRHHNHRLLVEKNHKSSRDKSKTSRALILIEPPRRREKSTLSRDQDLVPVSHRRRHQAWTPKDAGMCATVFEMPGQNQC